MHPASSRGRRDNGCTALRAQDGSNAPRRLQILLQDFKNAHVLADFGVGDGRVQGLLWPFSIFSSVVLIVVPPLLMDSSHWNGWDAVGPNRRPAHSRYSTFVASTSVMPSGDNVTRPIDEMGC